MLLNENEPFADHHIKSLESVKEVLTDAAQAEGINDVAREYFELSIRQVEGAISALIRYKICFADEVAQKERMKPAFLRERGLLPKLD